MTTVRQPNGSCAVCARFTCDGDCEATDRRENHSGWSAVWIVVGLVLLMVLLGTCAGGMIR